MGNMDVESGGRGKGGGMMRRNKKIRPAKKRGLYVLYIHVIIRLDWEVP